MGVCETNVFRITLLYFAVGALDILGELDSIVPEQRKKQLIDWIYSLQITQESGNFSFF